MAPKDAAPHHSETTDQAADGRPFGVGHPTYAEIAAPLLENGYEPIPLVARSKRPAPSRWSSTPIDAQQVEKWIGEHGGGGVGLRTGRLVGLDIDVLDPNLAHAVCDLAIRRFGETLVRVGRWPKRLLLFKTIERRPKRQIAGVEVLGLGQQFVAFGVHPDTGQPYDWPLGETPLDTPLDTLPVVAAEAMDAFLAEASAILPQARGAASGRRERSTTGVQSGPVRDADGLVVDGRDGWLSSIAFHATHDAADAGDTLDPFTLAARVWDRFAATTALDRPRQDGGRGYGSEDALRKVEDKLRLLAHGRLPCRDGDAVEPVEAPEVAPIEEARAALDRRLVDAAKTILAWWTTPEARTPAPQIGVRATVGMGKSAASRRHVLALRRALIDAGAPDRVLVLTPSLKLADEAAEAWAETGVGVAVHRGYEARSEMGETMCRDIDAVRTAVRAGLDVHEAACIDRAGNFCAFLAGCAKQANRRAVGDADVVLAAYDALYTGLAMETSSIGLILIDEGPWPRACEQSPAMTLERLAEGGFFGMRGRDERVGAAMADLYVLRRRLASALDASAAGPLERDAVIAAGLTAEECRAAVGLERRRIGDPGLRPGLGAEDRRLASRIAARNDEAQRLIALWMATGELLEGDADHSATIRILGGDKDRSVVVSRVKSVHVNLRDLPVLHLDATLRPALARRILPRLETQVIEADAPHMTLRLVTGGFGKTALIANPGAGEEENARRISKLRDCVDYVASAARRVAPGRTLVITYKDCEGAFAGLPGVETAHFNAVAGLDAWRDVALLIVVGRPLPSDGAVAALTGAFFGRWPQGGYSALRRGVRMRSGETRGVRIIAHDDADAETLRAAICDDELIQAIGRGRGVNRTAANPLEAHVLADVALPMIHDAIQPWETAQPDLLQRMLLAGVAVDSPMDAVALHPAMFANVEQAKKQYARSGFKGHLPISNTHRGMSLKSARYRRPGKGRSWSTAWWLDDDAEAVRVTLTRMLGPLAAWVTDEDG